ncbi:glucose-1-phosphate adenylyltransferase [bacterium]|nr:glucose-1-phosphate adenylyltransferase [bacterium]
MIDVLVMILAGGRGERLYPLTRDRAKPAVPFGGRYRIIDFVLSNFINSGFFRVKVLSQYRSNSLLIHLARGFNFGSLAEHYVDPIPAAQGVGEMGWYIGTADAIYQNLSLVQDEMPQDVAVFGGDHIYKMDVRQMMDFHREHHAACTVAALPFDRQEAAGQFGIIEVDEQWRIVGFEEKPADPRPLPSDPTKALVSMGNYIFDTEVLEQVLHADHATPDSSHDFGKDVLPAMISRYPVYAYNFLDNTVPGEGERERGYWRDVGTIDSYFDANMDLRSVSPMLNLYNHAWPIRSVLLQYPPVKFVFDAAGRCGHAVDSIVANGAIISGGRVQDSVVFNNVFVHSFCDIAESILMQGSNIGRSARLRRVICDKYVTIEDGTVIGEDPEADAERFHISPGGVVVIPKGAIVPREGPIIQSSSLPPPGSIQPRIHEPGSVKITPETSEA